MPGVYINWSFVSASGPEGMPARRLCCAFDATYLLKMLSQLELRGKRGVVGGAWCPQTDEDHDLSFFNLQDLTTARLAKVSKAGTMLLVAS